MLITVDIWHLTTVASLFWSYDHILQSLGEDPWLTGSTWLKISMMTWPPLTWGCQRQEMKLRIDLGGF